MARWLEICNSEIKWIFKQAPERLCSHFVFEDVLIITDYNAEKLTTQNYCLLCTPTKNPSQLQEKC